MTVRVYKSTDAGAPVLTGLVGSLILVLDACLVTGYGGNTPAGWTKPYSGADKAVFKPQGANGYYRVDDSAARSAATYGVAAEIVAYETMTGVDSGVARIPLTGSRYWLKSGARSSDARPWIIIADEFGFYLCSSTVADISTTPATYGNFGFVGKMAPSNESDAWAYGLAINSSDGGGVGQTPVNVGVWLPRTTNGAPNNSGAVLSRSFNGAQAPVLAQLPPMLDGAGAGFAGFGYIAMDGGADWSMVRSLPVKDSFGHTKRAFFPGLYSSLGTSSAHSAYATTGTLVDGPSGPSTLMCIRPACDAGTNLALLVDVTTWGR